MRKKKATTAPSGPALPRDVQTRIAEARSCATELAEHNGDANAARAANVLLALGVALARGDERTLRALNAAAKTGLAPPVLGKPFPADNAGAASAKDFFLAVVEDAIRYWLPGANGESLAVHPWSLPPRVRTLRDYVASPDTSVPDRILFREPTPPSGFDTFSSALKMAVYIETFALRAKRWTGILPPLPRNTRAAIEAVIEKEVLHGRLSGPAYARTLCIKILGALGMKKPAREAFFAYRDRRRQRR